MSPLHGSKRWLLLVIAGIGGAVDRPIPAADQLQVVKYGDHLFIRSPFSSAEHLVVRVGKGSNAQVNFLGARLIPAGAGTGEKEIAAGRLIHGNGDDSTPWNINGTYIGANHGCSDLREVTAPGHGRTAADSGSLWEDAAGTRFCLLKILDKDRLWFLSENFGQGALWKFRTTIAGTRLTRKEPATELAVAGVRMAQLTPACRIKLQQYLADGSTPLAEGRPVRCARLDVVEQYDIINPASLLADVVAHPGMARDFVAAQLDAVIANRIVYRFYPNGANVINHTATALQDFTLGYMGFIQSARLTKGDFDTLEYYIPKTRPFTQDGIAYDFRSIQDYSFPLPSPVRFSAANQNIESAANPPDRFVQFLGRKAGGRTVHEVGYALGYSLTQGLTRPEERSRNAAVAITLHTTSKSYPVAVDSKQGLQVAAGTEFDCVAYRQYFHPAAERATSCVFWHEEMGETMVYADYHRPVDRELLELPHELTGKPFTVVEKTPSVTVHGDRKIAPGGVEVSVHGDYGHVVLRIREGS